MTLVFSVEENYYNTSYFSLLHLCNSDPVQCDQPILVFSHKLGLSRVDPEGKACSTHFTRLSYDGNSSVVLCEADKYRGCYNWFFFFFSY